MHLLPPQIVRLRPRDSVAARVEETFDHTIARRVSTSAAQAAIHRVHAQRQRGVALPVTVLPLDGPAP